MTHTGLDLHKQHAIKERAARENTGARDCRSTSEELRSVGIFPPDRIKQLGNEHADINQSWIKPFHITYPCRQKPQMGGN